MLGIIEKINPLKSIYLTTWTGQPFELHNTLNQLDIQIDKSQLGNDVETLRYFFHLLIHQRLDQENEQPLVIGLQILFNSLLEQDDLFLSYLPAVEKLPFDVALSVWIVLYKAVSYMVQTERTENIRKKLFKIIEKKLDSHQGQLLVENGILLSINKKLIPNEKRIAFLKALHPNAHDNRSLTPLTKPRMIAALALMTLGLFSKKNTTTKVSSSIPNPTKASSFTFYYIESEMQSILIGFVITALFALEQCKKRCVSYSPFSIKKST